MATFRMSYVQAYKDRHGRQRYYYRRPGRQRVPLLGEPGSVEFAKAYAAARAAARLKPGQAAIIPGSFSELIADYYEGAGFKKLKPITQKTYRNALEAFRNDFGDTLAREMDHDLLDEVLAAKAHKPGSQQSLRKVLRPILRMALRRHLIKVNPMEGLRLPRKAIRGFPAWSAAECAAYEAKWKTGSRERLAYALLLYTAQRRSDVVTMGRQHLRDGLIHVVQQKTGTRLGVPVHSRLATKHKGFVAEEVAPEGVELH